MAPPVPIPNTAVKHLIADGSASIGCARVGRCQYYEARAGKLARASFFYSSGISLVKCVALPFFKALIHFENPPVAIPFSRRDRFYAILGSVF